MTVENLTRIEIRLFLRADSQAVDHVLDTRTCLLPGRCPLARNQGRAHRLLDAHRSALEVVENLQQLEDDGESFDTIEDIWPDYPSKEDFFFNEDEY